jgi:hypothetical protein
MVDDVFASDQTGEGVFGTLVGEGKKFDNAEALAAGKLKSDEHIVTIEQENAELKTKLEAADSTKEKEGNMKEIIDAIKDANTKEGSESGQTMSTDELEQLVRKVVAGDRGIETKDSNRAKGNELVLKLVDGNVEAAKQLVTERATALGMSPDALRELSEQSPDAFATLISPDKSTASSGDLSILPSVNTDVLENTTVPL